MSNSVCAVVFPARGEEDLVPTLQALEQQTRRPDELVVVQRAARFHEELQRALEGAWDWFWLLDGSAVPEPSALERLLGALGYIDPSTTVLLASKVVMPDGSLDAHSLPILQVFDGDLAADSTEHGLLSLRIARRGSLLVRRRCFATHGVPAGGPVLLGDDLMWTARLLKFETGLLVPTSVAVRHLPGELSDGRLTREDLASWLRLVFSDALEPRDRSWFAGRLVEQALRALRGAARR